MKDKRKLDAIDLMVGGTSITAIAKQIGVSRQTIYTWSDDPEFQRQLANRCQAVARLALLMSTPEIKASIETLVSIRDNEDFKPDTRLRAATSIIEVAQSALNEMVDLELAELRSLVESKLLGGADG